MWIDILVTAFVAQLMVLPGEKVQVIIAGLSTRYHPLTVVGAAGLAFGIWTFIEIQVGGYIKDVLPGGYLDIGTAVLFLLFAVWIYRSTEMDRSARATSDGGVASWKTRINNNDFIEVPHHLRNFLPIFLMMWAGEFGDKTQLVTIGLASQYGASSAIWFGEMLAIIPVSLANAYLFYRVSDVVSQRYFRLGSATIFVLFALDTFAKYLIGVSFLPI